MAVAARRTSLFTEQLDIAPHPEQLSIFLSDPSSSSSSSAPTTPPLAASWPTKLARRFSTRTPPTPPRRVSEPSVPSPHQPTARPRARKAPTWTNGSMPTLGSLPPPPPSGMRSPGALRIVRGWLGAREKRSRSGSDEGDGDAEEPDESVSGTSSSGGACFSSPPSSVSISASYGIVSPSSSTSCSDSDSDDFPLTTPVFSRARHSLDFHPGHFPHAPHPRAVSPSLSLRSPTSPSPGKTQAWWSASATPSLASSPTKATPPALAAIAESAPASPTRRRLGKERDTELGSYFPRAPVPVSVPASPRVGLKPALAKLRIGGGPQES